MRNVHKNKNGFSLVELVLVVFLIALICATGWFEYSKQRNALEAKNAGLTRNNNSSKSNSSTKPSITATSNIDWGTYTSTLGGFSFKYPTSGWTFDGFQNYTAVNKSQMDGNETQLRLFETDSTYSIIISIGAISQDKFIAESDMYSQGTATTLSNGLQAWLTNASAIGNPQCYTGSNIDLDLVSNGNFYYALSNGQYLSYFASFCYQQRDYTNLTYKQQVSAPEVTVAKDVLDSFKFK